ncbi:mannuronan 5-epimerase AlgG [Pseudomonas sp. 2FG]|uniref:mannuronan 5-epimerase AlgG n=1 Tax=Pseudomonas sp. 2FG TaxID=2502191 RepID=UPI0010F4EBAC|nr:mannuronan 5-epimerase AlgG [Pseudomonas sp. 2FG]
MDLHRAFWHRSGAGLALVAGLFWATAGQAGETAAAAVFAPAKQPAYRVSSIPADSLLLPAPTLPDLSPYSAEAVYAKIVAKPAGNIVLRRMLEQNPLVEFTGGDERLREWVKRQGEMPQVIFIEGGYVTPADLARSLPPKYFRETEPGVYLARLPIVVSQGATLHIGKETKDFRLSSERGAFLINDGKLFITDTRLTAWREADNQQDWFKKKGKFRPFLNSWGGTETYIVNTVVSSLGYTASKSYGVSISQYSPAMHPIMQRGHPMGWLLNSTFDDMWYGFYCYEAYDVVLRGNTYRNNLVYGIDPHDRSRRLIIAENTAYGTVQKHGIIVSREVNDSWIFNNRSYENHLSGIVVDRSSVNNLIAHNEVYRNQSDGITLYESGNNLLWGNRAFNNGRHGIRVRNSMNVGLYENLAAANGLLGIYGHVKDLKGTDRDLQLDPFDMNMSLTLVGGRLIGNESGAISVVSPQSVKLYQVEMLMPIQPTGIGMFGALADGKNQIIDLLVRQKKAVLVLPVDKLAQFEQ